MATTTRRDARPGPLRTCVGCRAVRPAAELVRCAIDAEGTLAIGRTLPGRGAWLCRGSSSCLDLAVRRGGFARTLRTALTPESVAALRTAIEDGTQA